MRTTRDLVSDEEVTRVHANANFGDLAPRAVVDEGVLKTLLGYSSGHTMECIVAEHGLVQQSSRRGGRQRVLTAKGKRYAQVLVAGRGVAAVVAFCQGLD